MKRLAQYAAITLSLLAQQAFAADLYLQVFQDDAPVRGVTVLLDERNLGSTDSRGRSNATLEPGSHVLRLESDAMCACNTSSFSRSSTSSGLIALFCDTGGGGSGFGLVLPPATCEDDLLASRLLCLRIALFDFTWPHPSLSDGGFHASACARGKWHPQHSLWWLG